MIAAFALSACSQRMLSTPGVEQDRKITSAHEQVVVEICSSVGAPLIEQHRKIGTVNISVVVEVRWFRRA
jgi:hypothetical protein